MSSQLALRVAQAYYGVCRQRFFLNRTVAVLALLLVCFSAKSGTATVDKVSIDLFFSHGCADCERVKREIFPELEVRFEDDYEIHQHDMAKSETIPLLLAYQERCGNTDNGHVSLVVDHTCFLSGFKDISTGLFDRINEALVSRQDPAWLPPKPPVINADEVVDVVRDRADALTFSVVAVGGLLDGFNPCAISTLIFFLSVLTVAKACKRVRLLVGISFIAASFLVYTALGLGILFAFRLAPNFTLVKKVVEVIFGLCMLPLAVLSFRDASRFRKSQRPDDVTLQIPNPIKDKIHAFMHSRLAVGGPVLGGLVTGAGVTILESVCTGQSYIPVLMFMLKQNHTDVSSWAMLITYNLLFVLPLAVVFLCFHHCVELKVLIGWSKRNLVVVKILFGVFFSTMAILLLFA